MRPHDGALNGMAPHELSQEVDSWLCVPTSADKVTTADKVTAVPVSPADTEQPAAPNGVRQALGQQAGSTNGVRSSGGVALDECAPTEEEGARTALPGGAQSSSQPQPPGAQGLELAGCTVTTLAARPAVPASSERPLVVASGAARMGALTPVWAMGQRRGRGTGGRRDTPPPPPTRAES